MAPSRYHEGPQEGVFERLPSRQIRLHHDPYVSYPHPNFQLILDILLDKLDLWYAARMLREMCLFQFVRGMRKRRKSCVDTIIKISIVRLLCCLHGYEVP